MRLSELTATQFRHYFESRLANHKLRRSGIGHMAQCPWHEDRNPSLSVNLEKGIWKCHAGCGQGGVIDFEKKFSSCDDQKAISRIAEVIGAPQLGLGQQPEAVYQYTDSFGKLLFQVVRYPGKRFTQRKPDGNGGWIYKTQDLKMVLYNLPKVVTAKQVIICEGEKDCDNLTKALGDKYPHLAVTTSPRGAGKWVDEYSIYFAGKQAAIIPDNDEAGRKHADTVARSIYRFSQQVKTVSLEGVPEKGDVSDFLKSRPVEGLIEATKKAPWWKPPVEETSLFMSIHQFEQNSAPAIDWLLEGIIQRGANGLFIARPKAGKSWAVLDMAIAMASGQRWFEFYAPRRARVALVSREDHGGLTQWRERKLRASRNLSTEELEGWLYINAKGMRPKIVLDSDEEVRLLVADLKRYQTEFLILDVMRVLHSADENDNTEMQKVIGTLNRIQDEAGCSICLVHHDNKREEASLTERARGASAIAGYAEFICGIKVVDDKDWTREFACELKASMPPEKFYWRIQDTADDGVELKRVEYTQPQSKRKRAAVEEEAPF